jgi:hypothetical protein
MAALTVGKKRGMSAFKGEYPGAKYLSLLLGKCTGQLCVGDILSGRDKRQNEM